MRRGKLVRRDDRQKNIKLMDSIKNKYCRIHCKVSYRKQDAIYILSTVTRSNIKGSLINLEDTINIS